MELVPRDFELDEARFADLELLPVGQVGRIEASCMLQGLNGSQCQTVA